MDLSDYVGKDGQNTEARAAAAPNLLESTQEVPAKKQSYIGTAAVGAYNLFSGGSAASDVLADQKRLKLEQEIGTYSGGFLKTATLFLRGRAALPLTLAAYVLDEAKPGDSVGTQFMDATLGAAKGGAMRGAFSLSRGIDDIAMKGVTLGVASRATELGLTRENWRDSATGDYSFGLGARRFGQGVFAPKAIVFDVMAFGASSAVLGGADRAVGGAITRSPFLSTMLTGTTFGITTGGLEELQRQTAKGELDIGELGKRMAIRGALDTVAAIPGGLQARRAFYTDFNPNFEVMTGRQLSLAGRELRGARKGMLDVRVENPNAPKTFTSEADFMANGLLVERTPGRIYSLGKTEIAVPESYAVKLDAVRRYRLGIEKLPESEHAAYAQKVLGEDVHLARRALPEDFIQGLKLLPDGRVKRITLLNQNNPEDVWHRTVLKDPTFRSQAAELNSELTFFKPEVKRHLPMELAHEWTHVVRDQTPQMAALYDAAARLESGGYLRRPYAGTQPKENHAVHMGEDFLHRDVSHFHALASEAPLRAVAIAESLKPILRKSGSPWAPEYQRRVDYVQEQVLPVARQQLTAIVAHGQQHPGYADAALMLTHLK